MTTAPAIHASAEAEAVLLACCIALPETVSACITAGITGASFHDRKHGLAFAAAVTLAARGGLDAGTLAEELKARGQFTEVGGYPLITAITAITSAASSAFYIERVGSLAKQRRLIEATTRALDAANQPAPTWADAWDRAEPFLRDAQAAGAQSRRRTIAEVAAQAVEWRLMPDVRPTAPTPWPTWDRAATAPREGELIVIAGRPGTGKTTLAGNIAHDTAASGKTVAFFSLEMGAEELVDRFALRRAGRGGIGDRKSTRLNSSH